MPILLAEPITFKVAASTDILRALNSGEWFSQVGKFITVYPSDDGQAVRFAVALDEATSGMPGPDIPSDRPLRPGSRVHYRYGGFGGLTVQNRLGEILPALRTPNGELVPDLRRTIYQPPDWVVDPFLEAGVAVELPMPNPLVGERYLIVAVLYRSAQSAVYLAVDLVHARRCVLKQAAAGGPMGAVGREHGNRLRHEAEILERLAPDPCFPAVLDLIEQSNSLYLVMEYIPGETLEQHIVGIAVIGRTVPGPRVIAWGRELAAMLAKVHAAGLVYRDLKSANVLVTPTGSLRLIDFDVACEQGHAGVPGIGTRGYISPQQYAGASTAVSDDVYSLGALLAYIATAAEPSQAPRPFGLLDRPLSVLNPRITSALSNVIARCLAPDPAARFPTMAAVDAALIAARRSVAITAPPYGSESVPSREGEEQARSRCRDLARRLGDTLCSVAERPPDGPGLSWVSNHPLTAGMRTRDLNTGAAGTLLALSELVAEFGDPMHRTVLAEGACWLENALRPGGDPLPGLYVGEAGVGAALLRAGQVMGDQALVGAAAARGDWIATMPYSSPDLFNGTAGRLRFHLLLWEETAVPEYLAHAIAAGEALLATVEAAG
ncbi:MAG: protein kinase, partial [Actinomycetota bacterium]|nr:protein kinase [Actinomycetota bacterium]